MRKRGQPETSQQAQVALPEKAKVEKAKVMAKKPRISPSGHVMPEQIPSGEVLKDVTKHCWQIGKSIGIGGFGEIYLASDDVTKPVSMDERYVIKIEPHNNGPLFTEMHFYLRAAKAEMIEEWKAKKKLNFLGMPKFIASGSHEFKGAKYRFLVMERFGDDLEKKFLENKKKFSLKTVLSLGIKILDVLEYIHSTGYIHADIKASNLLLGYDRANEVFLVDYGLACKYISSEDKHKPYAEDPRKAHDGTIEYTSRDAHVGAHSRRGDLEILAYNLLHWLCGKLPWEDNLKEPQYVAAQKNRFMADIPKFLAACFKKEKPPEPIESYLLYVSRLEFSQDPNYDHCRKIFINGLEKSKFTNDGKLNLSVKTSPNKRKAKPASQKKTVKENSDGEAPVKKPRSGIRQPCGLAQTNRLKKSPRSKSKLQESLKTNSTAAGPIPTPAMLHVMQLRVEKMKPAREVKNAKSQRRRSHSASEVTPAVPLPKNRRRAPARRGRSSSRSSGSSSENHKNSMTPPLF